jgi:hypothetical protein
MALNGGLNIMFANTQARKGKEKLTVQNVI